MLLVCNTLKGKKRNSCQSFLCPKSLKEKLSLCKMQVGLPFFFWSDRSARHNSEIRRKNVEKARKNNIGVIKNSSFGMAWHDLVM